MYPKLLLTTLVALAPVVLADASDTEPCAQVSKLVADANQDNGPLQKLPLVFLWKD